MKSILGLLLMQVVIPSGEGMSVAQKIEVLAQSAARSAYTMLDLFEDETVRGEIKRVGLDQGCPLANRVVSNALAARHDDLLPMARKAVEGVIPASRLETMRPVTFMMGVGSIYRGRVMERLEVLAAAELSVIQKQASALPLQVPAP